MKILSKWTHFNSRKRSSQSGFSLLGAVMGLALSALFSYFLIQSVGQMFSIQVRASVQADMIDLERLLLAKVSCSKTKIPVTCKNNPVVILFDSEGQEITKNIGRSKYSIIARCADSRNETSGTYVNFFAHHPSKKIGTQKLFKNSGGLCHGA